MYGKTLRRDSIYRKTCLYLSLNKTVFLYINFERKKVTAQCEIRWWQGEHMGPGIGFTILQVSRFLERIQMEHTNRKC